MAGKLPTEIKQFLNYVLIYFDFQWLETSKNT